MAYEADDTIYSDPRLTKCLHDARDDARQAYKYMVAGDLDNAKLYLASVIGMQSTMYELYRPEEQVVRPTSPELPNRSEFDEAREKTKNFMSKFNVR